MGKLPDNSATIKDCSDLVDCQELVWIALKDGRRLAARLWLPKNRDKKVPAILEYLPYRRRDGTRGRDEPSNMWTAAQGYACIRVDISGSGDSDGLIEDEYVKREQDDALEVIDWLVDQPWCSGAVGMIGISWGGFNGLQVAARQPPALKAVISLCSTVDRYHDDVHFMGGCLLADNLDWGSIFFTLGGLPPDPAMVGEQRWKSLWKHRLENLPLFPKLWLEHQHRDAFWEHGSVIEDYAAIEVPVLAVSGWADGYTNTVFKLVENLSSPCKGIVGPWGHKYPHQGIPGPAIGFLQECVRWWDRWLKEIDNGVDNDPTMRLYLQDSHKPVPDSVWRYGRWLGLNKWPIKNTPIRRLHFGSKRLVETSDNHHTLSIHSPQTTGMAAGEWCAYAMGKIAPELPMDQREDDAGSLVFDSDVFDDKIDIVGKPRVRLRIASDTPRALVAVRLNDIHPNGLVTRLSYGVLNLTHRNSHSVPESLNPGQFYDVLVELNEIAQQIPAGHQIRVSISSSYWPMIWPSADSATLTLQTQGCSVDLPLLCSETPLNPVKFEHVVHSTPLATTELRGGSETREIHRDIESQCTTYKINRDDGLVRIDDIGTQTTVTKEKLMSVKFDDPLSATAGIHTRFSFSRDKWNGATETKTRLTCDSENFYLTGWIQATEHDQVFFEREFTYTIKRDLV